MKELLLQYLTYNAWAHQQLMNFILSLPEEKQKAEISSSFPSLYKTALHMWGAENIWWQRVTSPANIVPLVNGFTGTMQDIANGLMEESQQWLEWVIHTSEESLDDILHYKTLAGDSYSQPMQEIVLHVCNHGTYHRGQMINMIHQLGITGKLPPTDFCLWARSR